MMRMMRMVLLVALVLLVVLLVLLVLLLMVRHVVAMPLVHLAVVRRSAAAVTPMLRRQRLLVLNALHRHL